MVEVSLAKSRRLSRVDELLAGVLTDRLEHSVPRGSASVLHQDQGLVDEVCEKLEDGVLLDALPWADGLGRVECPPPDKNGQSPKEEPLGISEEVVAPVDHGPQGLLAGEDGSAAARQETESVVQPLG